MKKKDRGLLHRWAVTMLQLSMRYHAHEACAKKNSEDAFNIIKKSSYSLMGKKTEDIG